MIVKLWWAHFDGDVSEVAILITAIVGCAAQERCVASVGVGAARDRRERALELGRISTTGLYGLSHASLKRRLGGCQVGVAWERWWRFLSFCRTCWLPHGRRCIAEHPRGDDRDTYAVAECFVKGGANDDVSFGIDFFTDTAGGGVDFIQGQIVTADNGCLLYTSPSPRD